MWASALRVTTTHGPRAFNFLISAVGATHTASQAYNTVKEIFKKPEKCPICKENIDENGQDIESVPIKLPNCGHQYHLSCLNNMQEIQNICAVCEANI